MLTLYKETYEQRCATSELSSWDNDFSRAGTISLFRTIAACRSASGRPNRNSPLQLLLGSEMTTARMALFLLRASLQTVRAISMEYARWRAWIRNYIRALTNSSEWNETDSMPSLGRPYC